MRGFEIISKSEFSKTSKQESYKDIKLPERKTTSSAGYDFYLPMDIEIKAGGREVIYTGIKAYMRSDEVLFVVIRSSLGIKDELRLANQLGVIDSDYYNNPDNEGHIIIVIENTGTSTKYYKKGERIAQGIFSKYLVSNKEAKPKIRRLGGFGSTDNPKTTMKQK